MSLDPAFNLMLDSLSANDFSTKHGVKLALAEADRPLVHDIVQRLHTTSPIPLPIDAQLSLLLDIAAVHLNGRPLDLKGLLAADDMDFGLELLQINTKLDRDTGKLKFGTVLKFQAGLLSKEEHAASVAQHLADVRREHEEKNRNRQIIAEQESASRLQNVASEVKRQVDQVKTDTQQHFCNDRVATALGLQNSLSESAKNDRMRDALDNHHRVHFANGGKNTEPGTFEHKASIMGAIARERARQINLGYTPAEDDKRNVGQLAAMAGRYASKWTGNSADHRANCIKAAALLVAEIERIDRSQA